MPETVTNQVFDTYSDFVSINVTGVGATLTFLRTLPVPKQRLTAGDPGNAEPHVDPTIDMEIVARIRGGHPFIVALRDLLNRTIERIEAGEEPTQDHAGFASG